MDNWRMLLSRISDGTFVAQHYTTSTKLYNAQHHFNKLSRLIPNQKVTDLMEIEVDGQNNFVRAKFSDFYLQKAAGYLGELDALFYTLRSCIDSFFWEINLIFKLECERATRVIDVMNDKCNDKKTNNLLQGLNEEPWFKYLNDIRNHVTHRKLHEIAAYTEDFMLYLPKELKNDHSDFSREKEFEVIPCISNLLENTKIFLEKGYGLIMDDLNG